MKERWKYWDFAYLKTKQRLTWRLYLRVIKTWFTPCDKCQEEMDKIWNVGYYIGKDAYSYEKLVIRMLTHLCEKCQLATQNIIENTEVILGNKDYEPPVEVSRKWIDVEVENKNGVLEPIIESVSKKEYEKNYPHKPIK